MAGFVRHEITNRDSRRYAPLFEPSCSSDLENTAQSRHGRRKAFLPVEISVSTRNIWFSLSPWWHYGELPLIWQEKRGEIVNWIRARAQRVNLTVSLWRVQHLHLPPVPLRLHRSVLLSPNSFDWWTAGVSVDLWSEKLKPISFRLQSIQHFQIN